MSDFVRDLMECVLAEARKDAEAAGQMTLDDFIAGLEAMPQDALSAICEPHSYRGYYDQLAFARGDLCPVAAVLADAKSAMGATFEVGESL